MDDVRAVASGLQWVVGLRRADPIGRLGSIYWFWEPDPEGYVQDARYTAKAERLTHFSLFYVYVPYELVEEGPHAPMPMLALRWPEQEQGVMRPLLREDSVLRGVGLYELDSEEWDWWERPGRASGVSRPESCPPPTIRRG